MEPLIGSALFIVILLFGYSFLQNQRERAIAKRLEDMKDPDAVAAMMNAEIKQVKNEGDMFEWFRRRTRL